jgi:RHS repeat-associated protein
MQAQAEVTSTTPEIPGIYGYDQIASRFTGYFRDSETGLDYADQRYHQPGMGRFITPDPFMGSGGPSDPGSWNRYAYAGGDPVNQFDPTGLDFQGFVAVCDPNDPDECADQMDTGSQTEGGDEDDDGPYDFGQQDSVTVTDTADPVDTYPGTVYDVGAFFSTTANGCQAGQTMMSNGTCDVPIYGINGQGTQVLKTAGNRGSHDLNCFLGVVGVGAGGTTLFQGGQPVQGTKPFVTPGSARGTSPISGGLRNTLRGARLPGALPTPVGGPGTGTPFHFRGTRSLGGFLGRWAPIVGIAGTLYGIKNLWDCLSSM